MFLGWGPCLPPQKTRERSNYCTKVHVSGKKFKVDGEYGIYMVHTMPLQRALLGPSVWCTCGFACLGRLTKGSNMEVKTSDGVCNLNTSCGAAVWVAQGFLERALSCEETFTGAIDDFKGVAGRRSVQQGWSA